MMYQVFSIHSVNTLDRGINQVTGKSAVYHTTQNGDLFLLFSVCVCVVYACMHMYTGMCTCEYTLKGLEKDFFETECLIELVISARLPGQQVSFWDLPVSTPPVLRLQAGLAMPGFFVSVRNLGIQFQVLMLAQQTFLPTDPSPQPPFNIFRLQLTVGN